VMFGEYIPLGFLLQWLRDAVGLSGLDAGTQAKCFRIDDVCIAPNICFESMVPHLISWQVRKLTAEGTSPAVLINLTNDSWFRGSSILDHHLACSMLCAVENRRPLLVAANTGISASIDGCGRLVGYTPRSTSEALLAQPILDGRWGLVQSAGYPLSWLAALVSLLSALSGMFPGLKMGAKQAV
jgi:apolipoprotein N-acyltransferase